MGRCEGLAGAAWQLPDAAYIPALLLAPQEVASSLLLPPACRAPSDCPEAVVRLVERCVQVDPAARPTAAEVARVIASSLAGKSRGMPLATAAAGAGAPYNE